MCIRDRRTAVRPDAKPTDLSQPGHIFPLISQPGGVLTRAGHTEAASDLPMLAGLEPAGVLVEVLNPDGSMARRPQLEVFAREHGLKMGSIADLIAYRLATEHTVERIDERDIETEFGAFHLVTYRDRIAHDPVSYTHLDVYKRQGRTGPCADALIAAGITLSLIHI